MARTRSATFRLKAGRYASSVPLVEMITVPTSTVASGASLRIWSMRALIRSAAVGTS
ncbi:hypothetical protein [Streptomyces sp. NPDC007088]|uniref:hypothetical protein n=1 Tax=Streptomyces sp. NPDC007088 TaxID=3364773 RepID=UPI003696D28B